MLGFINCNVKHITIPTFVSLYRSVVRFQIVVVLFGHSTEREYRGIRKASEMSNENDTGVEKFTIQRSLESMKHYRRLTLCCLGGGGFRRLPLIYTFKRLDANIISKTNR